jgi:hypothetical protein
MGDFHSRALHVESSFARIWAYQPSILLACFSATLWIIHEAILPLENYGGNCTGPPGSLCQPPNNTGLVALGNILAIAGVILSIVSVLVALAIYEHRFRLKRKSSWLELGASQQS